MVSIETVPVTWLWFKCVVNQKCIHSNSRCDLHPHPACVYNNSETGKMVAEDEEGCLKEYKANSLIETIANLKCVSAIHNEDSTNAKGTPVIIQAVKCDGISECWRGVDEDCGFSTSETMIVGNLCFFLLLLFSLRTRSFWPQAGGSWQISGFHTKQAVEIFSICLIFDFVKLLKI